MNMSQPSPVPTPTTRHRGGASWGISSLIIGILALLVCWIPILNLLAAPVGALGLLLGLISVVVAVKRQGIGVGFAVAGTAISALSLLVILCINGLIVGGVNAASKAMIDAEKRRTATNQSPVTSTPAIKSESKAPSQPSIEMVAKSNAASASIPTVTPVPTASPTPAEVWTPTTTPVRQGDVQIRVLWAMVAKVPLREEIGDGTGSSKEPMLGIKIEITNISQTKKVEYKTWAGADFTMDRDFATVADDFGNRYKRVNFGISTKPVGRTEQDSIYPSKSVSDLLIFEPPIKGAQYLNLELPAANFGGEGMIRLQIPARMIR
jgi:hypothetical protein